MINILKEILLDFQEMPLATGVPRRMGLTPVAGKASVCIGVRRGGKSTYMCQIMELLLASGVQRRNILYLNFFDDRLHGLCRENLNRNSGGI